LYPADFGSGTADPADGTQAVTDGSTTGTGPGSSDTSSTSEASDTDTAGEVSTGETTLVDEGSSTDASTGMVVAKCGDSIVSADEECDVGPDVAEDEHCVGCVFDRHVFVSTIFLAAPDIGGVDHADELCTQLAEDAGLANPLKYKAWLSDSAHDARDRVSLSLGGRYLLPDDETVVATKGENFLDSKLDRGIDQDEFGEFVDDNAWTGTDPAGLRMSLHCLDWNTTDSNEKGYYGSTDATDAGWTFSPSFANPASCAVQNRIYCFEEK
jgi:hypothetical protein